MRRPVGYPWIVFVVAPMVLCGAAGATSRPAGVSDRIAALIADPRLRGGRQGVIVESLADGTTWFSKDADRLFLPASNQKLLTSAAVLSVLGPDWRYVTSLYRTGAVSAAGVLHGDLVLKGSGDPVLRDDHLAAFCRALRRCGVRRITGAVVADASRFDGQRYGEGWCWDDMPYYYSAPVSGLNVDENLVTVSVEPGRRAGAAVRVSVTPARPPALVVNQAVTASRGAGSSLVIGRELGTPHITVGGVLALGAKPADHRPEKITVEHAPLYAAARLTEHLRSSGIPVVGVPRVGILPDRTGVEVARHASPPLSGLLRLLNKRSDNLIAECLLKSLAAEIGAVGSWPDGRAAVSTALEGFGVDPAQIQMADGSGLSRQNYVTPRAILAILKAAYRHRHRDVFVQSLPIAGVDGTLRNRMKGSLAERNCRAKTGYLSSVSSLSGYVTTATGEPLAFVILMNNHNARNVVATGVQNRIVELLASAK